VRKLKSSKRDENDILKLDLKIEWTCDVSTKNDLERIICSIAIARIRVLTQPGPEDDIVGLAVFPSSGQVSEFGRVKPGEPVGTPMQPVTQYAKSGDVHIAYQSFGGGPINLVMVPGFVSNVENY
jgi:hypothetical protein